MSGAGGTNIAQLLSRVLEEQAKMRALLQARTSANDGGWETPSTLPEKPVSLAEILPAPIDSVEELRRFDEALLDGEREENLVSVL